MAPQDLAISFRNVGSSRSDPEIGACFTSATITQTSWEFFSRPRRTRAETRFHRGLDTERSLSSVVAPVVQSGFVSIQHREPTVSVHLCITMDGKPVDVRYERPSEWDGDTLVFTDKVSLPNVGMTICFRYDLRDDGRRLRAAEELRAPDRSQDNVWVFDRSVP